MTEATVLTPGVPLAEIHKQEPVDVKKAGDDDLRCWSVTTIIGIVEGWGLTKWKSEQPVRKALEEYLERGEKAPWLSRLEAEGIDSAVEYLTAFRWPKDELGSTELGSAVHFAAEAYTLTGKRPSASDIADFIDRAQEKRKPSEKIAGAAIKHEAKLIVRMVGHLDRWLDTFSPTVLAAEVTIYSTQYVYAGTADGFMRIDDVPLIVDYKTSRTDLTSRGKPKTPYAEAGLQLSAYRFADMAAIWRPRRHEYHRRRYYLLSQAEREMAVPVPEVEGGIVIYLTPERCEAYPVRCDETVFEAFLARLDDSRWEFETSKGIVGDPMTPPAKEGP